MSHDRPPSRPDGLGLEEWLGQVFLLHLPKLQRVLELCGDFGCPSERLRVNRPWPDHRPYGSDV